MENAALFWFSKNVAMLLHTFVFNAQNGRQIDQNDVKADQPDVFPADFNAVFTAEKTKKARPSRQHQPKNPAVIGVHFHVADSSEIFAVPHVDDIFCLEFAESKAFVHQKNASFRRQKSETAVLFYANGMAYLHFQR